MIVIEIPRKKMSRLVLWIKSKNSTLISMMWDLFASMANHAIRKILSILKNTDIHIGKRMRNHHGEKMCHHKKGMSRYKKKMRKRGLVAHFNEIESIDNVFIHADPGKRWWNQTAFISKAVCWRPERWSASYTVGRSWKYQTEVLDGDAWRFLLILEFLLFCQSEGSTQYALFTLQLIWEEIDPISNIGALKELFGLELAGPFKLLNESECTAANKISYLNHRFYYDPPEFQVRNIFEIHWHIFNLWSNVVCFGWWRLSYGVPHWIFPWQSSGNACFCWFQCGSRRLCHNTAGW